ncbi:MAG: hypothetical protein HYY24_16875 [Verrucomicrobia bacterium]|nr:hypothetical protein [Verrucomicrobiota bacterium]
MNIERKEAIATRFIQRPMLFMLVRALLFSWWFRVFFVGVVLAPLVLAGFVVKLWRVTPPDFKPEVRISGLDYFQAWSLQRTANRHFQQNRLAEAVISGRAALANNPGDLESLRSFLREIAARVEPPQFQRETLSLARWLLRLSPTNQLDLEIAGGVLLHYGLSQSVVGLVVPQRDRLSDGLSRLYLKALFEENLVEDFAHTWQSHPQQSDLVTDHELGLYWAAYQAGWGAPGETAAAFARLEASFADPQRRVLAHRLALKVHAQRDQSEQYFPILEQLQTWQRDAVKDHVQGWYLLAKNQRLPEGVRRAQDFAPRPMTAAESVLLVQAYYDLGLRDLAVQALDRFTLEFSFADELWVTYANLLVEAKRWDQLRQLAMKMRAHETVGFRLRALSFYLEGRSELGQDHQAAADEAFDRIAEVPVENFGLAVAMAANLRRLGYPRLARGLLVSHQQEGESVYSFWRLLSQTAFGLKDTGLLLSATEKAFRLAPGNIEATVNYTAALLVTRQRPDEAMRYTFELLQKFPDRPVVRLNHAAALLQTQRFAEAARELERLAKLPLGAEEKANLDYLRCELLVRLGRKEEARVLHQQLNSTYLFPEEIDFLNKLLQEQPPA